MITTAQRLRAAKKPHKPEVVSEEIQKMRKDAGKRQKALIATEVVSVGAAAVLLFAYNHKNKK